MRNLPSPFGLKSPFGSGAAGYRPTITLGSFSGGPPATALDVDVSEPGTLYNNLTPIANPIPSAADVVAGTGTAPDNDAVVAGPNSVSLSHGSVPAGDYRLNFVLVGSISGKTSSVASVPVTFAAAGITVLGGQSGSRAANTSTPTVTFDIRDSGNNVVTLAENDLIVIDYHIASASDITVSISGYTKIIELFGNDVNDSNLARFYKFMGPTPDTSVVLGAASAGGGGTYTIRALRGVNVATPEDVTTTTATGGNTQLPNPAAITPTTSGALIDVVGSASNFDATMFTASYLENVRSAYLNDVRGSKILSGTIPWTSGAYDPAAFTGGGADDANSAWASITTAWRPA
jgi:hypothetical protein